MKRKSDAPETLQSISAKTIPSNRLFAATGMHTRLETGKSTSISRQIVNFRNLERVLIHTLNAPEEPGKKNRRRDVDGLLRCKESVSTRFGGSTHNELSGEKR